MAETTKNRAPRVGLRGVCCVVALLLGGCVAATAPGTREAAAPGSPAAMASPAPVTPLPRPELRMPPAPQGRSEEELWRAAEARAVALEPLVREDLAKLQVAALPAEVAAPAPVPPPRTERPASSGGKPSATAPGAPAVASASAASLAPAAGIPNVDVVARYQVQDGLPSNRITAIYVDDDDAWVGTADAGIARYNFAEGNWLVIQAADGLASDRVSDVVRFGDRIYVGTQEGLSIWDGASWRTVEKEGKVKLVNTIFRIHKNELWVAARTMHGGLLTFDGETWKDRSTIRKGGVLNNIADFRFSGDELWIGTTNRGVYHLAGTEWQSYTVADGIASNFVYTLGVRGTTCYLGGCCGLSVREGDEWRIYDIGEGLPHSTVNAIQVDGNVVWLGSKKGLAVFDGLDFVTFYTTDGLTDDRITSLFIHRNQVWVGTADGLNRLEKSY
ncbi:MAG: two-component regulator propeller domain-containing protein [Deferrisomatales bacterium]|nr:two-component regulator propeller domain-containing protein [Deferrisomatales bacterium]